jgi:hypothetical protein
VLRFTVQNLETGDPVTNLLARVAIFGGSSNQEMTFLLTNISAPDGRFSINVIFPNIGSYQIITRLMSQSHVVSSLASFTVTVPAMANKRIEVHASNNPVLALSEFKSNFYDLILPDINIGIMIEQQRVNAM